MINIYDIVGRRIGQVLVLSYEGKPANHHKYRCVCVCGKEFVTYRQSLACKRKLNSCGCINPSRNGLQSITHGMSKTSIYNRWRGMFARCYDKASPKFCRYGARGIRVCQRWHDFKNFLVDMGPSFKPHLSLDRIDVNGHYSPRNCRWTTQKVQQNNRCNNRVLTIDGQTRVVTEWARISGLSPKVIRQRIDRDGMSPSDAVFAPRKVKK